MKNFFVYLFLMTFLSNPLISYALENSTNSGAELDGQVFNIASADVNAGNKVLTVTKDDKLGKAIAIVSLTEDQGANSEWLFTSTGTPNEYNITIIDSRAGVNKYFDAASSS